MIEATPAFIETCETCVHAGEMLPGLLCCKYEDHTITVKDLFHKRNQRVFVVTFAFYVCGKYAQDEDKEQSEDYYKLITGTYGERVK